MPREGPQRGGAAVLAAGDPALESVQLRTIDQLARALCLAPATIRRRVAAGDLPQPAVRLGARLVRWRLTDLRAWLSGQPVRT